jgi:NTE family protein
MRLTALILGGLLLAGEARSQVPEAVGQGSAVRTPLRIGLVLSGGGARGMAHVGVLKVLDDMHVHVDAIAGTSMGAVVGGLYASGMSGRDIEQLLNSRDWQDAFRERVPRDDLSFRRKEEDRDFLVNFPLGIQGRELVIPTGLVQEQKLTQLLRRVTLPSAKISRFDELPIRFRAVATDLETGDPVVMDSGDLATALRASMSAPGVFPPVERDGRLLVDGGLVENLPIDVARAMNVDVLIVVDAGFALQTRDHLNSLSSVSNQALAILVRRDVDRQRVSLTPKDLLLQPVLGVRSSYDFSSVDTAVYAGEAAARIAHAQLAELAAAAVAAPPSEAAEPAAKVEQPTLADTEPPTVQFIATERGSERYERLLKITFADQLGKPLDAGLIAQRLTVLYGSGDFEVLDFHLQRSPQGTYGLVFSARRNSWGPNYLRVGLSLQDDFKGNSTFNAAGRVTFTELNTLGAEALLDLRVGESPLAAAQFYQPLSVQRSYFIAPRLEAEAHDVPQLVNGNLIGEFRVRTFEYGLDFGREFGNWGQLRGGILDSRGSTYVQLGDFDVPEESFHTPAAFLRFSYDRLDSADFPRQGQALALSVRSEFSGSGAEGSDLATFDWRAAWSHNKDTLMAWLSGGSTIGGSDTNVREYFPLGGFLNLSGLLAQSLAGPHYAIARAIYLHSVGNGGAGILDVPAYIGASLELGNVWSQRSEISVASARRDASLFFGADTYIGPVYLAVGYDEGGSMGLYLFLGHNF